MLKENKEKLDKGLAESKNEEALLEIDIKELIDTSNSNKTRQLNDTLSVFSVIGTDDDVVHNEFRINELTKKANDLEDEVVSWPLFNQICLFSVQFETTELCASEKLTKWCMKLTRWHKSTLNIPTISS
jgi:hypothetical protein